MTQKFSLDVLFLSLAVVMFTIGLMYVHTVLDFESDMISHKKTLVCRLGSKKKAIDGVWIVYGLGYLFTLIFVFLTQNFYCLTTFILLPLIYVMHKSLKSFVSGGDVKEFYFRLLKARNLMVYFSLIVTVCLVLKI